MNIKKSLENEFSYQASEGQNALWFLHQLDPTDSSYNLSRALIVEAPLDLTILRLCVSEITEKYEGLRTTFSQDSKQVRANVSHTPATDVEELPLGIVSEEALIEKLEGIAAEPFCLTQGPLLRVRVQQVNTSKFILLVCVHHIVVDGWSLEILMKEFADLYQGHMTGQRIALRQSGMPASAYYAWQKEVVHEEQGSEMRSYWIAKLAGVEPTTLHRDGNPKNAGAPAEIETRALNAEMVSALKNLSHQEGTTLFVVLLAAFKLLLCRMTDRNDVLVASPYACRTNIRYSRTVGLLANTLLLRTLIPEGSSIRGVLHQVKKTVQEGQWNQHYPYSRVVDDCGLRQQTAKSQFAKICYTHRRSASGGARGAGPIIFGHGKLSGKIGSMDVEVIPLREPGAQFELSLTTVEYAEGLHIALSYDQSAISRETTQRILTRFVQVLEQFATFPDRKVADIEIRPDDERDLAEKWLQRYEFPTFDLYTEFSERVAERPDAVAMAFNDERISYRDLKLKADSLAELLWKSGTEVGTRVGILLEPGIEQIAAILGVLKVGGVYVPVDKEFPAERIKFILNQARCALALTNSAFPEMPNWSGMLIDVDTTNSSSPAASPTMARSKMESEQPAYIIFTSGSTGKPKGVEVSHGAVARLFTSTKNLFNFSQSDTWIQCHSAAFDFSVWEIFGALLHGGKLVIAPVEVRRDPNALLELIEKEKVTFLNQTPSAFGMLLNSEAFRNGAPKKTKSLKKIVFGGEALHPQALKRWYEKHNFDECALVNMYGITETTVHVTYHRITQDEVEDERGSPIGTPLPDLNIHLLDRYYKPVPIGVPGEIYVEGPGLARGYVGRDDLTSERFLILPSVSTNRLYRSGDIAVQSYDGRFRYLGRTDEQVKVRGFRIELPEIERVLEAHPEVTACVVVATKGGGNQRLVAYYLSKSTITDKELDAWARISLPGYMLPSAYILLDKLPVTPTGKVNRIELSTNVPSTFAQIENYVAPTSAIEKEITDVLENALSIAKLGVKDNFFSVGGDSILSLSVVSELKRRGLDVNVSDIFTYPTISELARNIELREPASNDTEIKVGAFKFLDENEKKKLRKKALDAFPLSALQMGMLFHSELDKDSDVYQEVFSIRVPLKFDLERMRESIQFVADRHPILKTSIHLSGFQQPIQIMNRQCDFHIHVEDISSIPEAQIEKNLSGFRDRERQNHFDLSKPPLIRFFVHRVSEEHFQLTVVFHHVLLDGWSLANLIAELLVVYHGNGAEDRLLDAPPGNVFAEYIRLERNAESSAEAQRFWLNYLDEANLAEVPSSIEKGASRPVSRRSTKSLGIELTESMSKLARECGVPLKTVLLAVHASVVSLVTGRKDVITGVIHNGRPEILGADRAVGIYLNTLPFRVTVKQQSWRQLIADVHESEKSIHRFRRVPLPSIQKWLSRGALFEWTFNYIHMRVYEDLLGDLLPTKAARPDLYEHTNNRISTIFEQGLDGVLSISLRYLEAEFSQSEIERIEEYYVGACRTVIGQPTAKCRTDALLGIDELRSLEDFSAVHSRTAVGEPLLSHVENWVKQIPDKIVVEDSGIALSWSQMWERSGAIAEGLKRNGIRPDDHVGVEARRQVDIISAIIAVWRCGAVFVPIDAGLPEERLSALIQKAQIRTCLMISEEARLRNSSISTLNIDELAFKYQNSTTHADHDRANFQLNTRTLAYILFTSGSTGKPKGVAVSQHSLVSYLEAIRRNLRYEQGTRFSFTGNVAWDHSYTAIFSALYTGGTICIPSDSDIGSPEKFARYMSEMKVDVLKALPSMLRAMLESTDPIRVLPRKQILFGGERLNAKVVSRIAQLDPSLEIINLYGPTETTISCTIGRVSMSDRPVEPTIGVPLDHVCVFIMDGLDQLCPVGTTGEIVVGGCIAQGYVDPEDDPNGRFGVVHVFGRNIRVYRTGDFGFWTNEGEICFKGRRDEQVKVRGYRIELPDVESAIRNSVDVTDVAVAVRSGDAGTNHLVAYVVLRPEDPLVAVDEMREKFDESRVADWMETHDKLYAGLERAEHQTLDEAARIGWNSNFTGEPFSQEELHEYVENYDHLLKLTGNEDVLEIGCGAGQVLLRLAPKSRAYWGTDLSNQAVSFLGRKMRQTDIENVQLRCVAAHQINEIGKSDFDRIVFASVAHKFPSLEYLQAALSNAISVCAFGGQVVLSDVRDFETLKLFHTELHVRRSKPDTSLGVIAERVERSLGGEAELAISPKYFHVFGSHHPRVSEVSVRPKRGSIVNELTSYRYDVVVKLDYTEQKSIRTIRPENTVDYKSIEEFLKHSRRKGMVALSPLPNLRLAAAVEMYRKVHDNPPSMALYEALTAIHPEIGGVDPEQLFETSERLGYEMRYSESHNGAEGNMTLEFKPQMSSRPWA